MFIKIKVPLHVSGIWIPQLTNNILESGSTGCGLNLDLYAELLYYTLNNCYIDLNNRMVFKDHSSYICGKTGLEIGVKIYSPIDLGYGFGVSGASSLIHALVSAIVLKKETLLAKYASYAHEAEVIYKTGLGDVISQYYGGVEIRLKPGAPGYGVIKNISIRNNPEIIACTLPGNEDTPLMLSRIDITTYKYGEKLLRKLVENPVLEAFFEKSQLFTRRVFDYKQIDELLSNWSGKIIGFYRKKQALIIWCERDWCSDLLIYLNKHGLKCCKTFINTGGFRIAYTA